MIKKSKIFEKCYFFDEKNIFEKIEKSKILKISHFVKDFNTKCNFHLVLKSLTKCENFQNFRLFDFFENKNFIEKNNIFREKKNKFSYFSYLMPKSSKWHHVTPSRSPVRQKRDFFYLIVHILGTNF